MEASFDLLPVTVSTEGSRHRKARAVYRDGRFQVFARSARNRGTVERVVDTTAELQALAKGRNPGLLVSADGTRYEYRPEGGCGCGLSALRAIDPETW